jgi:cation diffusion facilitator CzcD-associated flavoprotein CzcO
MLDTAPDKLAAVAGEWLENFEKAISRADVSTLENLFLQESYWRDALALTWQLETFVGPSVISKALATAASRVAARSFEIDTSDQPPQSVVRVDKEIIEAFFTFETEIGRARGIVRLAVDDQDNETPKAWTFFTELDELKGHEEKLGRHRATGQSHSRDFRGPNWLDQRNAAQAYKDRDPTVLIVGGGQAGLATAARLTQLGVDTLIIDKHERIGDNWRKRYHALTLHNQVQVNHLPYLSFPDMWPIYIPKDKLANWFESYVDALELNYWTSAELVKGSYDESAGQWTVTLRRGDGSERELRPEHIVMATGVSGIPNRPDIPTLEQFTGRVVHSSEYQDGDDWTGKRAIVIGTGNSGHDIAQDLTSSGAHVTLVQRSPTLVVNLEPSAQLPYSLYCDGPSLEACDLITSSMPTPLVRRAHVDYTKRARELDQSLLEGLKNIGFRLDFGEDKTGWQFKYLTRGGGYYFNVGCSDMLVEGKIDLLQYDRIGEFTTNGVRLDSGETLEADLIVLSTGYMRQEALVEKLFGTDIASRVGEIWGFGDQLELRNMYCQTGQPGLWFIAGSLAQCRINSKYLALQIKANAEGLI